MDYHNLVKEMVTQWRTVLSSFYIQIFSEGDVHEDKRKKMQTENLAMENAFLAVILLVPAVAPAPRHYYQYGVTERTYPARASRDIVHGKGGGDHGAAVGRE